MTLTFAPASSAVGVTVRDLDLVWEQHTDAVVGWREFSNPDVYRHAVGDPSR
jgi:hypothetical protein